jgi:hypothetical protein
MAKFKVNHSIMMKSCGYPAGDIIEAEVKHSNELGQYIRIKNLRYGIGTNRYTEELTILINPFSVRYVDRVDDPEEASCL